MTTLTTNRFLTKALRLTCYATALTACSAWATVVDWQSPIGANGSVGVIKDLSQREYTNSARGLENRAGTDASQPVFEQAPQQEAATLGDALNENPTTRATDAEQSELARSEESVQISTASTHSADSFLVADLHPQPVLQSGGALAHAFDEEFVSVPTVQFASVTSGSKDLSGISMAAVSTDPAPVPEMSALFPIIGLIAAVSCTQILRRRRAAQLGAPRRLV
jgi:hypothetical protein